MTDQPAGDYPEAAGDAVQPFQLDISDLRGRHVVLDNALNDILERHRYPAPVARLLAEALVVTMILSDMLKYDGVFTLQTKGDGPVPMLVADITSEHEIRGYAMFNQARLDEMIAAHAEARPLTAAELLGRGYLAFTVDQGEDTERYQGIVEMEGDSFADFVRHYFRQSEQLETGLQIAVSQENGHWRAAGLALQRLPPAGADIGGLGEATAGDPDEENWRRAMVLLGTLTSTELLDPALSAPQLLYRLFHEEGVRVFEPAAIRRGCRCSRQRIEEVLRSMNPDSLREMAESDPELTVTCEFCAEDYVFQLSELV